MFYEPESSPMFGMGVFDSCLVPSSDMGEGMACVVSCVAEDHDL